MVVKVLICDQLPIVRDGLRTLLDAESDITVVDSTDSGIAAMVLARKHHPHVIVTGLALRGMPGLELIRRLHREPVEPVPRIVVFSMSESDEVVDRVLHAGVNGLLVKEATREQIGSAVRVAARGQVMLAPEVATRLVNWFREHQAQTEDMLQPVSAQLTSRERQVLTLLGRGLSIEEVAAELFIGVTTVRTHVYRLRTKLKLKDRAQLVSFAFRAGLMRSGEYGDPGGAAHAAS